MSFLENMFHSLLVQSMFCQLFFLKKNYIKNKKTADTNLIQKSKLKKKETTKKGESFVSLK